MQPIRCEACGEPLSSPASPCPSCGGEPPTVTLAEGEARPAAPDILASVVAGLPRPFGRFRLLREIGRGGMGIVFEAEDTILLRTVALKTLHDPGRSASARARFEREARIAGTLDHPNVVPVFDYGVVEGVAYYTMPFVRGLPFERVVPMLHGGETLAGAEFVSIPTEAADRMRLVLEWFEGALAGLEHAHRKGIIHRDLKPSNLILDASGGRLRITDFGLARAHHLEGMTGERSLLGTVAYMSPEQVARGAERLDHRSDLYSMGVTLYKTLFNRLPYEADTAGAFLEQIATAPPEFRRGHVPHCPPDLRTILLKAMEKHPELRYPNASDFAGDLGRFRRYEPIRARSVGPAGRLWRWSRRKPATAALSLVLIAVTAGAGGLLLRQLRSERALRRHEVVLLVRAGHYAAHLEDYPKAAERFGAALRLDPGNLEARMGRALALENVEGGIDEAIEDLRRVEHVRPDLSSPHVLLSRLLGKKGETAAAAEESAQAARLPPQLALDFSLLGDIAHSAGDCAAAIPHYTDSVRRDPQNFWAILKRGMCHAIDGDLARARIDYEIVTHLVPEHAVPHNNLANVLIRTGEEERALDEYRRALELEADNATIRQNYGESLRLTGDLRTAEAELRRALVMDPRLSTARLNLGMVLAQTERRDEALPQFLEVIRQEEPAEKGNARALSVAYTNVCDEHLARRDLAGAAAACEQAVILGLREPANYYNLAAYRMMRGDGHGALEALEKDAELGDRDADYLARDEVFVPLRGSARFAAILRRMRASPAAPSGS